MDFSLLGFINEFLKLENHLDVFGYLIPFNTWNPNVPITFYYIFIYIKKMYI